MKCSNIVYTSKEIIDNISDAYYDTEASRNIEIKLLLNMLEATVENQLAVLHISTDLIKEMDFFADGFMEEALKLYPKLTPYFPNATEQMKLDDLEQCPSNISKYKDPSDALKYQAIKYAPSIIKDIKDHNKDMAEFAISISERSIKYINDEFKTLELQKKALDQNAFWAMFGLKTDIPKAYINQIITHPEFINDTSMLSYKNSLNKILTFENIDAAQLSYLNNLYTQKHAHNQIKLHPNYKMDASLVLEEIMA